VFAVAVADHVVAKAHDRFGAERTASGAPSAPDFVAGPLAAARIEFSRFDDLPEALGSSIRAVTIVDPFFGAVVFVGVLVAAAVVEIADFEDDPGYWSAVDPPLD
jgi:hypothetical protein